MEARLKACTYVAFVIALTLMSRRGVAATPGTPNPDAPWLLLLFIPAAFSFVCPTEVIAFQNCYDEFRDRHCSIAFVSVDTKHSLWHWQNVPRQYGGLGNIDLPLLSDATHKIGRDYGVLVVKESCNRSVQLHKCNTYVDLLETDHAEQPHCRSKCARSSPSSRGFSSCREAWRPVSYRLEAKPTCV